MLALILNATLHIKQVNISLFMMELLKFDNVLEIGIVEGKHIISFSSSNKTNEEIFCDLVAHLLELM